MWGQAEEGGTCGVEGVMTHSEEGGYVWGRRVNGVRGDEEGCGCREGDM